jgi:serine/threonine protein kinase
VLPNEQQNLSRYNIKVRNRDYISPEQISLGTELEELLGPKNGRLIPEPKQHHYDPFNITFTPEVNEFHQSNQTKVSTLSDIYSIGAILYKLLIGTPPDLEISDHITKKRMWDKSPD